jgi:hypothetical protein
MRRAESGKFNALRHGLLSDQAVVTPGVESVADYKKFRKETLEDLDFVGALELALGEQIVQVLWRLRRVSLYETAVLSEKMRTVDEKLTMEAAKKGREVINPWLPLVKVGRDALKISCELLKRLPKMRPEAPVNPERALHLLLIVAQVAAVALADILLPGVPDDSARRSFHHWSAGNVQDALPAIALKAHCDPEGLAMVARLRSGSLVDRLDAEAEPLHAKRHERHRLHLLPQAPVLDLIMRYQSPFDPALVQVPDPARAGSGAATRRADPARPHGLPRAAGGIRIAKRLE